MLLDSARLMTGERRQITVLMCDVMGSTALSQQLDPEDLHEMLSEFQAVCQEAAERNGGYISQFLGDGVQIYFGFPRAREDDARRAVECGLDILEAMELPGSAAARATGARLRIRAGADTGRVVVSPLGTGARREHVAMGDAPNIAARVQAAAQPGTLWVTDATWRIVHRHFLGESRGEHELKGVTNSVGLWSVKRSTQSDAGTTRVNLRTPYVGRGREHALLEAQWDMARAGSARYVIVRGEPGIGKSRLVAEFRRQSATADAVALVAACTPNAQNSAFLPVIELLLERLALDRALPAHERLDSLEARLAELDVTAPDAPPLMAALLSIPGSDRYAAIEMSPARQRARTMEILVSIIRGLASKKPTILIVEDLHWADPSTIDFLRLLAASVSDAPLLGLFTARLDFQEAGMGEEAVQVIEVPRLDASEVETIVRSVASGKRVPGQVLHEIEQRCDGVPLFVEEMARSVIEDGVIEEHEQTWELSGHFRSGLIPASIDASLMARIDRLGSAGATAQLGATIGREFSHSLIQLVSDRSPQELAGDLERIVDSGLVWKSESSGSAQYVFKHALVRDAAYESLLRRTRQAHHARIAQVLRERFQDIVVERPELVAHHLTGSGNDEEAIEFWRMAGQRSLASTAMREAAAHFQRAIESVARLPKEPRWLERELDLQNEIAPVLMTVYGWGASDVRLACERAREIATRLSRFDKIYPAAWGLWTYHFLRGEMDEAATAASAARAMAEASAVPMIQITGRHATAYTHLYRGEFEEAVVEAEAGLALFDFEQELRLAATFQLSSTVAVRTARATALWMLGRVQEAREERDRMVRLGRELGHTPSRAAAMAFELHSGLCFGWQDLDVDEQLRVADELCALCEDEGFALWHSVAMVYRGAALVVKGRFAQGRSQIEDGFAEFIGTGARLTLVPMYAMCARSFLLMNDHEQAWKLVEAAQAEADSRNERMWEPEIDRTRAAIQFRRGDPAGAEASLQRALEKARRQKARSLETWIERDMKEIVV